MEFSFIVPCYNGLSFTRSLFSSFLAFTPIDAGCEIIFVDDGSEDATPVWLQERTCSFFRCTRLERNSGFASAVNAGLERAAGHFTVLLNNDLILTPGWFEPFMRAASRWSSDCGIVGNVQRRALAPYNIDHAGIHFNRTGYLVHRTGCLSTVRAESDFVTGACIMLKTDVFRELGGLDTGFLNGAEDIDLCLKLCRNGKQNYVLNESVIFHHVSATRGRTPSEYKNLSLLYSRWQAELASLMQVQFEREGRMHELVPGQDCKAVIARALASFQES